MRVLKNIHYQSDALSAYFRGHRDKWADFYPSERWVMSRLARENKGLGRVLDVGCASGGLGKALAKRRLLSSYVGVDISRPNIEAAVALRPSEAAIPLEFECGDILQKNLLRDLSFDTVFSLSCADWNIETDRIINACWARVAPGGRLIISLRLTDAEGVNDIRRSYQPILADGQRQDRPEIANYVVFNINDILQRFVALRPAASRILSYGYWGTPSKTAVTPYKRLVFAVFAIFKETRVSGHPGLELYLPIDLWRKNYGSRRPRRRSV